jgi:primosomal protein N' (replication factor Y)
MHLTPACEACGSHHLELRGLGTEKIEEEMNIFFPKAVSARLDLDTARSRQTYLSILSDFEDRKIDILVGTQMITKGLDFDNVNLVGIINADQLLNFPDFRAFERSFQLLQQVSGRSGRKFKRGHVIIQTHQPLHWVLQDVVSNNYEGWYQREMEERQKFQYPPHHRLIEFTVKHRDAHKADDAALQFAEILKKQMGHRVFGPHDPLVKRVRNYWLKTVLLKIEKEASPAKVKEVLNASMNQFYLERENRSVIIQPDVDPL